MQQTLLMHTATPHYRSNLAMRPRDCLSARNLLRIPYLRAEPRATLRCSARQCGTTALGCVPEHPPAMWHPPLAPRRRTPRCAIQRPHRAKKYKVEKLDSALTSDWGAVGFDSLYRPKFLKWQSSSQAYPVRSKATISGAQQEGSHERPETRREHRGACLDQANPSY